VQGPVAAPGKGAYLILKAGGGFYAAAGDLAKRFPHFAGIPVGTYYKSKSDWTVGIDWSPFLGNRVQTAGLFGDILGPSGELIDQNGYATIVRYYMRGYTFTGRVGKLIALDKGNRFGKIEIAAGAGFMQHRIKMRFDARLSPQLESDYRYGYDRMTNGLQLVQNVRWHYLNPETLSFFIGLDFGQGFTQNRRNWNFSEYRQDDDRRIDSYFGFSAGILIPIALKRGQENPRYFE
jgi:hypothetical protein